MLPSASNITMPSAVVSRMAASSSALAWPTADGSEACRRRVCAPVCDTGAASEIAAAIASPSWRVSSRSAPARNRRPMKSCRGARRSPSTAHPVSAGWLAEIVTGVPVSDVLRRWRRRVRHRARRGRRPLPARAGCVADPRQESRVGIQQPVEPVDQDADRQQIEQRLVAPGSRRARAARAAPAIPAARWPARAPSDAADGSKHRFDRRRSAAPIAVLGFEPRRQLPREFVEGAVFRPASATAVSASPSGRNGKTFFSGLRQQFPSGFRQNVFKSCFQIVLAVDFHGRFQIGLM